MYFCSPSPRSKVYFWFSCLSPNFYVLWIGIVLIRYRFGSGLHFKCWCQSSSGSRSHPILWKMLSVPSAAAFLIIFNLFQGSTFYSILSRATILELAKVMPIVMSAIGRIRIRKNGTDQQHTQDDIFPFIFRRASRSWRNEYYLG